MPKKTPTPKVVPTPVVKSAVPPPSAPSPKPPTSFPAVAVVIFLAVILVGSAIGVFLFKYSQGTTTTKNKNTVKKTNTVNTANDNTNVANVNSDANANANSNANANTNANTNTSVSSSIVTWHEMTAVKSLNLLPVVMANGKVAYDPNSSDNTTGAGTNRGAKYYEVGTINSGTNNGATVYMALWYDQGPQFYPTQTFWYKKGTTYYFPTISNGYFAGVNPLTNTDRYIPKDYYAEGIVKTGVKLDQTIDLGVPQAPIQLVGTSSRQILIPDTTVTAQFDSTGLTVAFTDPTYGPVYWNPNTPTQPTQEMMGQVSIRFRNGFYVKNPLGMMWVYHLKLDYITYSDSTYNQTGVPQITWTNGKVNATAYTAASMGGCGATDYLDLATGVKLTDLKSVGTTAKGDTVYEYSDSNNAALKSYYNDTYQVYGTDKKVSYATFVAAHPIIFVTDPFSRLIRLTSNDFKPQVECGKPVIYLYPTKTTNVSVQLNPLGGFTKTVPAYNGGWNVTAQPDGTLTNLADGQTYPYLFWEGRGGIYQKPDQGFVVAQADVHSFLVSSLAQLGLNQKETADFIEFWEPRMQGKPWYFVSFYGTKVMDQLAPLSVTPRPDTIIRVLMDFTPLDHQISVTPYTLTKIPRTGFTVIEWGGVLR